MNQECDFYICATCFETSDQSRECHGKLMIHCASIRPGDERLKPLLDDQGHLKTRAPKWFLDRLRSEESDTPD